LLIRGLTAGVAGLFGASYVPGDALAATTDFTVVDMVYATPLVYDHRLGGGAYNGRVVGFTADSDVSTYDSGEYLACGDYSTFLIAIKVKPNPINPRQTLEFDLRLDADSSTASGAGFVDIGTVAVNYGAVANGKGAGGVDAGMIDDHGSTATLVSRSFQYASGLPAPGPYVTGSQLVAKIQVNDLEAGEQVIVRVDARLGCKADGVTGGAPAITAGIFNIHGVSPVFGAITGSTGNKGANTYYPDLFGGASSPWIWDLKKTVTTSSGTCPGVERLDALSGAPVKYCYELQNTGTQDLLNLTIVDDNGTPGNPADDFPVTLTGLSSKDGGTLPNDLVSGGIATGQAVAIADFRGGALLLNTAVGSGVSASGASFTRNDTAGVNVSQSPARLGLTVQASLDGVCGNADDADPIAVASGTPVRFCYRVTNNGSVALTGITVADPGQAITGSLGLAPGASGYLISASTVAVSSFSDNAVASASYGGAPVTSNHDSASVIVPIDRLAISVTASLDPTCAGGGVDLLTVRPGTTVYYCYQVSNGGETDLGAVTVSDPLATVPGSGNIPAGGSKLYVSLPTLATADITHAATALGLDPWNFPVVSPVDLAGVNVVSPSLLIEKTVSLDGSCPGVELAQTLVGQAVTYCYEVTNSGDINVSGVLVNDAGGSVLIGDLAPGRSGSGSSTFSAKADESSFAVATGSTPEGGGSVSSAPDDAGLDVIHPALALATTVSTSGACPGDEVVNVLTGTSVTWCYTVTNTGDVAVSGISATDDQNGAVPGTAFSLQPGQSATLSRGEAAQLDTLAVAVATGLDSTLGSAVTSNQDPAAVNVVSPTIDIDVTVSLDGTCPGVDSRTVPAGVSVTPCYVVTNNGDETLFDVVILDGNGQSVAPGVATNPDEPAPPAIAIPLFPSGATQTFAGAPTVVTGDGTFLGTASGTDVFAYPASDTDNALVDALFASLVIEKTVSTDGSCPGSETVSALAGQEVTTCYHVINTGDLPVTGIVIVDGGVSTPLGDLGPRESGSTSVTAPATGDSNGPAVASGTNGGNGNPVQSPPDAAVVDVVHPALVIEKTVSTDGSCPGAELVSSLANQMVTFCYTVTNTGDTAVSGVVVDDEGRTLPLPNLGAGQSASSAVTRIVVGDDAGAAVASGTTVATGTAVSSPPNDAAVDVIHPALSIATTVSTDGSCPGVELATVLAGAPLTWCYAVTNTGDVAVAGTLASDARGPVPGTPALVAPGETFTFTRNEPATSDTTVSGVAAGVDAVLGSAVQSNVDPAAVDVVHPAITLDVTVSTTGSCPGNDTAKVAAGTSVLTCYTVTNSGDDTVTALVVSDAARGTVGAIPTLPPGGSVTLTGPALLVQDDTGVTGTAAGVDEHGFPVSAGDAAAIDALFPGLTIAKTVSLDGSCPGSELVTTLFGHDVTTCYTVTNTGELPLGGVIIDDGGAALPVGDLAPGASASTAATAPATHDDDSSAVASGLNLATGGVVVSAPDGAAVDVVHPALSIQKTASLDGTCTGVELVSASSGTAVTWCYTVTNTGDTAVSAVSINDAGVLVSIGDLAPGESASDSSTLVASDDLSTTATASGTATAPGTPVKSPPDGAAVDVIHPSLSIATTVSISGACPGEEVVNVLPGTTIKWCYAVTNTGDVAINGVTVSDNRAGVVSDAPVSLAAGATHTFALGDTGSSDLTVVASAAGVDAARGKAVESNQDPAAVNVVHPGVDVDVTVSTDGTCPGADSATVPAGTVVTYCYQVANLGDDTLGDVIVKDRDGAVIGTIASLTSGEIHVFSSAPGPVVSDTSALGGVTAIDPYGFPVSDTDTALVDALFDGLTIQKTASLDGSCPGAETVTTLVGQTVTYCYTVTNSGDIAVKGIAVHDGALSVAVGALAPGQSSTVKGGLVAGADTNTPAVAAGINALTNGAVVSPPDSALVDVVAPALVVQKTASLDGTCPGNELVTTLVGQPVTYCYTVTNAGDTTVNAVTLTDDGVLIPIGALAAGQSAEATGHLLAAADASTPVVASGTVPATSTSVQSAPDTAAIDVIHPSLAVSTTVSLDGTCPGVELVNVLNGTSVKWCYVVTNNGDVAVTGVHVGDSQIGAVPGNVASLAPGQSVTLSRVASLAADIRIDAGASGTASVTGTPVVSGLDTAGAHVVNPGINIDVTVSSNGSCPGQDSVWVAAGTSVRACYLVKNLGDDLLSGIVVKDAGGSVLGTIASLAPGASQSFSGTPGPVSVDVLATATATGADLYGFPVSSSDSAPVHVTATDLTITKLAPAKLINASCGGNTLDYTITVKNIGSGSAAAPVMTDILPRSVTFVSATTTSGSCAFAAATTTLTCTLANLAPAGSVTIVVHTTTKAVAATASGDDDGCENGEDDDEHDGDDEHDDDDHDGDDHHGDDHHGGSGYHSGGGDHGGSCGKTGGSEHGSSGRICSKAAHGTIVNTATVSTSTKESNLANNSSSATTFVGTGATKGVSYYSKHPEVVEHCLASRGGMIDLGYVKLRDELHDDEIDVDTDHRVESGKDLAMGVLKCNSQKLKNGVSRSALSKARIKAAQQVICAVCNQELTGATPSFDVDDAVSKMAGNDVNAINTVCTKATSFNASKGNVDECIPHKSEDSGASCDDPSDHDD
jgi:uncharacterized repeat protein (TIGR01451 family)